MCVCIYISSLLTLQYSCLENPMDGGAWWAAVHGVAKSRTRLSDFTFTFHFHPLEKEMTTHSSVLSVMSDSVRPHRQQPTRLPCPWDSPGKNTGVGCHFLLQWMKVKSESEVTQSCLTLSDPMDCSPPGSSIHPGVLGSCRRPLSSQARPPPSLAVKH